MCFVFFFQAEDGIRDHCVTGVQTCALPISAGTATFSTANSKAFTLHVASAVLRPNTDQPTVGKVTVLGSNELIVKGIRGSLEIAVEDDVREIQIGRAHV